MGIQNSTSFMINFLDQGGISGFQLITTQWTICSAKRWARGPSHGPVLCFSVGCRAEGRTLPSRVTNSRCDDGAGIRTTGCVEAGLGSYRIGVVHWGTVILGNWKAGRSAYSTLWKECGACMHGHAAMGRREPNSNELWTWNPRSFSWCFEFLMMFDEFLSFSWYFQFLRMVK
jgi:hypothetical protein